MAYYDDYVSMQRGGGYNSVGVGGGIHDGGVGRIDAGSTYQRGHGGIGSFLAGVFRRVLPLFSRGAKTVGKEALRAGMNVMSDVATQNTPIKEALRNRLKESGHNLKRKAEEKLDKLMEGSGYKNSRVVTPAQLRMLGGVGVSVSRKSSKKKKITKKRCKKPRQKSSTKKKKKSTAPKKRKTTKKRSTRDIFD